MEPSSSTTATLAPSLNNERYKNDPILRPLIDLGMAKRDRSARHQKLSRASILVLLFRPNHDDEWHILLTQRPLHLKSHPGEVCCPGGRQDPADGGDDIVTALRETREEVGIPADEIDIISRMETMESVGGLCVTPIVGIWNSPVAATQLTVSRDEVEAVFYVPVSYFWDDANGEKPYDIDWRGDVFKMRTYHWKDTTIDNATKAYKIWGLTAHVVYEMAQICKPSQSNNNNTITTINSATISGPLFRWIDEPGSSGKPYWSERYYVLTGGGSSSPKKDNSNNNKRVLHQYDSESQANSKADTATKKNRLQLDNDCVVVKDEIDNNDHSKYYFRVSVLDGRIEWRLAATSIENRSKWMSALSSRTHNHNNNGNTSPQVAAANKKLKTSD